MAFQDLPRGRPGTNVKDGQARRALWLDPASLDDPFWQYRPGKIFLGETEDGRPIGVADNRHLITVAGSRAGKGVSAIIPNLLRYEGSVLVLDPKGENASKTAERRGGGNGIPAGGMGQEIHVLDPFLTADVPEAYRSGFNPLAELDQKSPEFIDDCDALADALVLAESGKEDDFWNSAARIVLRGFIAWVAAHEHLPDEDRNLGMMRRLLNLPKAAFLEMLEAMQTLRRVASGVPSETASFLLALDGRERASVMSTVLANLSFLASPVVAKMFEGRGRVPLLKEWKFGGVSVYLCLPATRLTRHSRFFRLFVTSLLRAAEADKEEPAIPALLILDEMHVLGRMPSLETAAGLLAGFGVRIWSIWQDFAQLKGIYEKRWETFLGNASVFQSFGLNDMGSLEYVSGKLGISPTPHISKSELSMEQAAQLFTGESHSLQEGPLLSPDEIAYFFSRQSRNQLVLYPGVDPLFLRRVEYLKSKTFATLKGVKDEWRR